MPPLSSHPVEVRYCAIVSSLARPGDIRSLPLATLHLVMTLRMVGLAERAGREPLVELAARLNSVAAAKAALALAEAIAQFWPEPFVAARPCPLKMTPDEATVAAMARSAAAGDRAGFGQALTGFVRAGRHEALFARTVEAVALLHAAGRN